VGRHARWKATEHFALDVVNECFGAVEARDFERAKALLSAENFSYKGPIERFENTAVFVQSISRIGPILEGLKRRRMFVDGDEVCAILNYETTLEAIESTRIAHWIRVGQSRITRMDSFSDARAYARMFDPEPRQKLHTGFRSTSCRAMMIRCISLVPSPMASSGASR
jgi:hypothetical protein